MFVSHTMRPFDASRPGTLSADELRKQSEMAKMVPCHILSSLSSKSLRTYQYGHLKFALWLWGMYYISSSRASRGPEVSEEKRTI